MAPLVVIDMKKPWSIHDYEGFESVEISEYESLETVRSIAQFIGDYPDFCAALLNHFCNELDEAKDAAEEHYHGCYVSLEDYVQDIMQGMLNIPEQYEPYFDYASMGRDMLLGGEIYTLEPNNGEMPIFSSY